MAKIDKQQPPRRRGAALTLTIEWLNDEDEEITTELPGKHAVCPKCEGHGTHLREGMRGHAYTREEFEDAFHDDEDREAYFTHGSYYDETCTECGGNRVVVVLDESETLDEEQKAALEFLRQVERDRADDARTMRYESGDFGSW